MKKEKAYRYGEVSKKELLQLEIELDKLESDFKHYKIQERSSRSELESKVLLFSFDDDEELLCKDMYKLSDKLSWEDKEDSLKEKSIAKRIQSAQSDFSSNDLAFNSYTLSATYQKEIDVQRVIFGLSIPLNFTSSVNTHKRAVALHKKSALEFEKEALKLKKSSDIKLLKKRLKQSFQDIELLTQMLNKYENELMPLIQKGYKLGESSAIEYLLAKRDVWNYKKNLIQNYKDYYQVLFELYSILQIKD